MPSTTWAGMTCKAVTPDSEGMVPVLTVVVCRADHGEATCAVVLTCRERRRTLQSLVSFPDGIVTPAWVPDTASSIGAGPNRGELSWWT
ncbi:hypothetical protein [Sphaerimonospora mesophila]|uniref:hypothetical protein n=1 Tax=Sphaerimonospora mesophila TaxID=37483 RepID=UPI000A85F6E8